MQALYAPVNCILIQIIPHGKMDMGKKGPQYHLTPIPYLAFGEICAKLSKEKKMPLIATKKISYPPPPPNKPDGINC